MGLGSEIRDSGSGKKPIPDSGLRVKKAPDPGFGSGKLMRIRCDPDPTTLIEASMQISNTVAGFVFTQVQSYNNTKTRQSVRQVVRIRDGQPGSYFLELRNHFFWGVKILEFFAADPGSGMEKFGSGMEKSRIRDPGMEKSRIRDPGKGPQH
jgi:hypothetical protein